MKLILLSEEFYKRHAQHKEILQKGSRPYVCLAIKINGCTFAIPLRHHIAHNYAFITYEQCGLDYTKSVIISSARDIAEYEIQINQKEYNALKSHETLIHNGLVRYIKLYKKARKYRDNPHYANILRYSSLQYFDEYI